MTIENRERPSQHGAILGEALAMIAAFGRKDLHFPLPEMCLTCAFREGCMTNQMAGTGKVALDCVLGLDPDRFACHHAMKEGEPSKLCVGYVAASLAPPSIVREVVLECNRRLNEMKNGDTDEIREAFDRWRGEVDPDAKMNDYELARAYEKSPLRRTPIEDARKEYEAAKEKTHE